MKFNFISLPTFIKSLKRLSKKYPSLKDDIRRFEEEYKNDPNIGSDLGSGIRKVRMSISSKNKGKSGGARVITCNILITTEERNIALVDIYDKSEQESIPVDSIKTLLREEGLL